MQRLQTDRSRSGHAFAAYTFTVRPGFRFPPPSGEAVTAESFRRGIEHALAPGLG